MRLCLLLCALALACSSCDSRDVSTSRSGFNDPPQPIVAGEPFELTASAGSNRDTYQDAAIVVFRGTPTFDRERGFVGDTLVTVPLDVQPGVSEFRQTVSVTVPADSVTEAQMGRVYLTYRHSNCASTGQFCNVGSGSEAQIVPAR